MNVNVVKTMVYRRFLLMRKNIITLLLGTLAFMVMGWLVLLSMHIGNLRYTFESPEEKISTARSLGVMFGIFVPFLLTVMTDDKPVFIGDIKCKWAEYSISTPMRPIEKNISRCVVFSITIALGIVISLLNLFVIAKINGNPISASDVKMMFGCIDVYFLTVIIQTPLLLHAKTEKQVNNSFLGVLAVLVLLVIAFYKKIAGLVDILRTFDSTGSTLDVDMIYKQLDKPLSFAIPAFFVLLAVYAAITVILSGKRVSR